jgi:hypothetical protein
LQNELEEAVGDSEASYTKISILEARISKFENGIEEAQIISKKGNENLVKQFQNVNSELLDLVKSAENESKVLKKSINEKDKEILYLKENAELVQIILKSLRLNLMR